MKNPRLHVICGRCGCSTMLKFEINPKGNCDALGNEYPSVYVTCENCGTLTGLGEVMKDAIKKEPS